MILKHTESAPDVVSQVSMDIICKITVNRLHYQLKKLYIILHRGVLNKKSLCSNIPSTLRASSCGNLVMPRTHR